MRLNTSTNGADGPPMRFHPIWNHKIERRPLAGPPHFRAEFDELQAGIEEVLESCMILDRGQPERLQFELGRFFLHDFL